jgi:hypothetical protein
MNRESRSVPTRRSGLRVLLFTLAVLPLTLPAAGGRRRTVAVSPPSSALVITFLDEAGFLDTGPLACDAGRRSSLVSRTVRMRIGAASAESHRTATVRAYLELADSHRTIRVDGVVLSVAPQVVRRHAPVGVASAYRIDIEVPATAPEGPFTTPIGWEVTTD